MENIYLAQPTNVISGGIFLPYSVASIAAYSWEKEEIKSKYQLKPFLFLKEDIDKVVANMDDPFLVGLSCYLWNIEYNILLAEKIKTKFPGCIIVAGGPQVPDSGSYLQKYEYFDILIHGEGETTFYSLLQALANNTDLFEVPNITYRKNGEIKKTQRIFNSVIESYPSPYLQGYFDDIIENPDYSELQFDAILETNRGCPYNCSYCAWSKKEKSVRCFSLEKIKGELDWIASHSMPYVFCADANFGLFERDEEIVDYIIALKARTGFPQKIETMTAKNKDDFVFQLNKKLHNSGLSKGVSIAVQSMSPIVLKNIHREKIGISNLKETLDLYAQNGIPSYTDMIIGLPGETFESFCRGLFEVLECGQKFINIFPFELLPNSELYEESMREKYNIKTIMSFVRKNHSAVKDNISYQDLYSEIVIATASMTAVEWKKTYQMATAAQALHGLGLLYYISQYLKKAKHISLYDFYVNFLEHSINTSGFVGQQIKYVTGCLDDFIEGKSDLFFVDKRFGSLYWPFDEALFLCLICDLDKLYSEIAGYVQNVFDVDGNILEDLISFQKKSINGFSTVESVSGQFIYDWYTFFKSFDLLSPRKEKIYLKFNYEAYDNLENYAREMVWFGKKQQKMFVQPEILDLDET